jgi:simple sugar transport system ATP-binding protein
MASASPKPKRHIERVEMRGITKRFPGVLANDNVSFDVNAGEVHALLGENGAGKSTLMRMLYGLYLPDEGEIFINGKPQVFRSPADAIAAGIGMIHQHFMLVPKLTVAENVALGLKSSREPMLDLKVVSRRLHELSQAYGLRIDPSASVAHLSVGEQQRVEILKALYRDASLIILDEPTAVLTPQEVNDLFTTLKHMVDEGHGLVFISHKLNEVLAISDRVSALRDGRMIGTRPAKGVTRSELVNMMVGREVKPLVPQPLKAGPVRLSVEGVCATGDRGTEALKGISLEIRTGEILGIAGVSGNGQQELAQCLAGLRKVTSGKISIDGEDVTHTSLRKRMEIAAYIPEERIRDGAIKDFSVQDNLFLRDHSSCDFSFGIFLRVAKMASRARELVAEFNVKTPQLDTPIKNLSGGNIQKLIMARELSRDPKMLIAAQPTRGVDIGATEFIHQRLLEQRGEGKAILLISEDLDEVRWLSDRIAVMYEGRIIGVVKRDQATVEEIGLMMAGIPFEEAMQHAKDRMPLLHLADDPEQPISV